MGNGAEIETKDDYVKIYFEDFIRFTYFSKYSFRNMEFFFEIFKDFFPKELTVNLEIEASENYEPSPMTNVLDEMLRRQAKWVHSLELKGAKLTKSQADLLREIKLHESYNEKWELLAKNKKDKKKYCEKLCLLMKMPDQIRKKVWQKKDREDLSSYLNILSNTKGRFAQLLIEDFFKNSVLSKGVPLAHLSNEAVDFTQSPPTEQGIPSEQVDCSSKVVGKKSTFNEKEIVEKERKFLEQLSMVMTNLSLLSSIVSGNSNAGDYMNYMDKNASNQNKALSSIFIKNLSNQFKICDNFVRSGKYSAEINKILELSLDFWELQKKDRGYGYDSKLTSSALEVFQNQTMSSLENLLTCIREKKINKDSIAVKTLLSKIKTSSPNIICYNKLINEYNDVLFEKRPELLILKGVRRTFFFELYLSDLVNLKRPKFMELEKESDFSSMKGKLRANVNVSLNALSDCLSKNKSWKKKTKENDFVEKEVFSSLSFDWQYGGADGNDYKLSISMSGNVFDNPLYYSFVKGLIDEALVSDKALHEEYWNSKIEAFCLDKALRLNESKKSKAKKEEHKTKAIHVKDDIGLSTSENKCTKDNLGTSSELGRNEVMKKISAQNLLVEKHGVKISKNKVVGNSVESKSIEGSSDKVAKKAVRL